MSASRPISSSFWLTPWQRIDEHLPLSHIAEVTHIRGFFWDAISVESSGGTQSAARRSACRKPQARYFVEHVRERLNEVRAVRSHGRRGS